MVRERPNLAVLIDGDNVPPGSMDFIFAKVATIGQAVIRTLYGSQAGSKKWHEVATRLALSQGRRHPQAKGCNATDIEMVIGAMDIMSSSRVDGFCLVSSDSDFTSLAIRLREGGKLVFGFGDERAPASLRHACDQFHLFDVAPKRNSALRSLSPVDAIKLLREAFDSCVQDGWAQLSNAAHHINKKHPGFSAKAYGSSGMKKLVANCGAFELARMNNRDIFRPVPTLKLVNA
jgi:hypothetical protein